MSRRLLLSLAVVALLLAAAPAVGLDGADRLDRFRTLTNTRLAGVDVADPDRAADAYREVWALLDEEIVDSLASGSVFASLAFLQDRLDGFGEAWGGASLKLTRVGPLTVGAFQLGDGPAGSSLRIYATPRGEAQLVSALQREGRPRVQALPPAPGGGAQFVAVWEGVPSGHGSRALRVDLVRQRGDDVAVAWTTAREFPEGLVVRDYRLRGPEVTLRYEVRYPGWVPGCEPQMEQEDVLRLAPDGAGFTRVSRRQHNAWHRALHRSVSGLFDALAAGNRSAVAALVPDAELRQRLPAGLAREFVCDAPDAPNPAAVSVAASAAGVAPWTLTFRRVAGEWRLTAATPVLP